MPAPSGKVAHRTLAELRQVRLRGTVETIPDLPEILALIGGRASLLIEVKAPRRVVSPLCRPVRRALEGYTGPVAVIDRKSTRLNSSPPCAPRMSPCSLSK